MRIRAFIAGLLFLVCPLSFLTTGCQILGVAQVPCATDGDCAPSARCGPEGWCTDGLSSTDGGIGGSNDGGPIDDGGPADDGGAPDGGAADAGCVDDCPVVCASPDGGAFNIDFQPRLARRGNAGPTDRGFALEGSRSGEQTHNGDYIAIDRGLPIGGTFYEHADSRMGTIVAWIAVEQTLDGLAGPLPLFSASGIHVFLAPERGLVVELSDRDSVSFEALGTTLGDGGTHLLIVRWDRELPLTTGRYLAVTVDMVTSYALTSRPRDADPFQFTLLGTNAQACATGANAVIEGFTVYRRPLFSDVAGIDVGNGDEVERIYAQGAGELPTHITGSWDVVLAVPGDQRDTGATTIGAGPEAFTHPYLDSEFGADGYLVDLNDDWQRDEDVSTTPVPAAERLYGRGLAIQTGTPGNGISRQLEAVAEGDDFVIRAIVHAADGAIPEVHVVEMSTGTEISSLTGTATSTRTAPDVLGLTFAVPPDPVDLRVDVANSTGVGAVYVHQVEVFRNLFDNPSVEGGNGADDTCNCYVPRGWSADTNVDPSTTVEDSFDVHSGQSALGFTGSSNRQHLRATLRGAADGVYYSVGGYFLQRDNSVRGRILVTNGALFSIARDPSDSTKFYRESVGGPGVWEHVGAVGLRYNNGNWNANNDFVRFGGDLAETIDIVVDDVYAIALSPVPIDPVAADFAASNGPDGLRVDGLDLATQSITFSATSGSIGFRLALLDPDVQATGCQGGIGVVMSAFNDNGEYIGLVVEPGGRLSVIVDGLSGEAFVSFDDAVPPPGLFVNYRIEYSAAGGTTLGIDGIEQPTNDDNALPGAFSGPLTTVSFGGVDGFPEERCAVVVVNPGAVDLSQTDGT